MIYTDNPWKLDFLFIKPKDKPVVNLPLCEVITGRLVKDKSSQDQFTIKDHTAKEGQPSEIAYKREGFQKFLASKCRVGEIEAFALQPEGEQTVSEVYEFLEKYDK